MKGPFILASIFAACAFPQGFMCSQQDIYVVTCPPWSILGNGTDETVKLQGLLNAVPNYSTIYFPRSLRVYTTGIALANRKGLRFTSGGGIAGGSSHVTGGNAAIVYHSSAPIGGAVFSCDGCRDFLFENLIVDGGARAATGFKFIKAAPFTGEINANVTFSRMTITSNSSGAGNAGWVGIDWCGSGAAHNCEFLQVIDGTNLQGQGGVASVGVQIGHSNSVLNVVDGAYLSGNHIGVSMIHGGTAKITRNLMDRNDIDISGQGPEPIEIAFNRTENGGQFFNGSIPVFIHDNRFSHHRSNALPWIYFSDAQSGITPIVMNNIFSDDGSTVFRGGPAAVISMGNIYPSSDVVAGKVVSMGTFGRGYTSVGDTTFAPGAYIHSGFMGGLGAPTAINPGCSHVSHVGKQWVDDTNPATTVLRVCLNVANVPTWVVK